MSITRQQPRTVHLEGPIVEVNDLHAAAAMTPGHLIERAGGLYQKHATAGGGAQPCVALEQSEMNKTVSDDYASGDLVHAGIGVPGTKFWMLIASGETISDGEKLESAGNGLLRALASGEALFSACEAVTATVTPTRLRVETL